MLRRLSFIFVILCITSITAAGSAAPLFKFPAKLQYDVYQGNQTLCKAALFFTPNTGIKKEGRELSVLRWIMYQENERDFLYLWESYVFRDDFSLYSDAIITGQQKIWDIEKLAPMKKSRVRGFNIKKSPGPVRSQRVLYNGSSFETSKVSSILQASRMIALPSYRAPRSSYYFSPECKGEAKITVLSKNSRAGKLHYLIALLRENREIARFTVTKDRNGYCYPVHINFNPGRTDSLRMKLNYRPSHRELTSEKKMKVLFLDFIDARSNTFGPGNTFSSMIHRVVFEAVYQQLKRVCQKRGMKLQIDVFHRHKFNRHHNVRRILDITFDPLTDSDHRVHKITDALRIPPDVDVIVTGQYVNRSGSSWLMVRPILIFTSPEEILTQNLLLHRNKIFCSDSPGSKYSPCPEAPQYIASKINRFFYFSHDPSTPGNGKTFDDIYRMVISNRLFCHPAPYGHHFEVLERLRNSGTIGRRSLRFRNGRHISARIDPAKEYIIQTTSVNKNNYGDVITLYWAPLEGRAATFPQAQKVIGHLNSIKYQGYSDWRIPTISEWLSIAGYHKKTREYFPFALDRDVKKLWTSTPLDEKEKDRLTLCNEPVYFVVDRFLNDTQARLQFDILCSRSPAYLLPVRSARGTGELFMPRTTKTLSIANLAFIKVTDRVPMASGQLNDSIVRAVKKGMDSAASENKLLRVTDNAQSTADADDEANRLTNIFYEPNLTKQQKIVRIVNSLMRPKSVDLMVSGLYIEDNKSDMITVRPMVIYGHEKRIGTENLQFRKAEFLRRDPVTNRSVLSREAERRIVQAVRILLKRS